MLALSQGEFVLDPNFRAPQQLIQASPEALLLEGMRRLDEGAPLRIRPIGGPMVAAGSTRHRCGHERAAKGARGRAC